MTIGNLGTGITLSSLASEWGQPATNVKLGDYTADRSTRNDDLYIQVQKITWSDAGPYQAISGTTTSGAPAVNRDYFKFNLTQLEMGVTWGDSLSDATGTAQAPNGRHIFSTFLGNSVDGGANPPLSYNNNHAQTVNGNSRFRMFWSNDGDTMNEFRDGQGPFRDMDVKRFVHPVQNQATGGNLAFTRYNPAGEEVTNNFTSSTDYCMLNFPIMYVTKRSRRILFALNSSVDIPFYICTTPNTSGSNLATGVTNNGAVYDTNSQYYQGGFTYVILDLQTANFPNTSGVTPTFITGASPNYYFPEHASDKTTASNYATTIGSSVSPEGRWQSGDKTISTTFGGAFLRNVSSYGRFDNPGTGVPVSYSGNTGQDPTSWNMLWVCSNQELMSQSWYYASKLGSEVPTYPAGGLPNSSSVPLHADIASVRTPLGIHLMPHSNPATVTKNTRPIWKMSFSGTGGTEYSPASYFPLAPYPTSSDVGIVKNGQTAYARQTCAAFSPLASNGTVAYSAMFYYPINYTSPGGGPGAGLGQNWSTGPYAQVIVRGDNGSTAGGNFVGGSGNYGNNGPDIAAYWANNNSNSFAFYGTPFPGSTNIAVNYSRSGAVLTVALTNNTGQDIYWASTSSTYGGMFGMSWYDGSATVYGNQAVLYGSGHQARAIDTNAYSSIVLHTVDSNGVNSSWTNYVYHTATASASTVATELANMINNRGGTNSPNSSVTSSQFPPGGNVGDGSGIYNTFGLRAYASSNNLYLYRADANMSPKLPQNSAPGPTVRTEYKNLSSSWDPNNLGSTGGNITATLSAPNGYTKSIMPALLSNAPTYGWRQSNTNLPISNVKYGVRLGDFANAVNAGTDGT